MSAARETRRAQLADVGRPPLPVPDGERPAISKAEYEARIAALEAAASDVDAVVVYADREHIASMIYLCNFDVRFEEALLVLANGRRTLIVGKEGVGYAPVSPLDLDVVCAAGLSLMGIDRSGFPTVSQALVDAGVKPGSRVGVVGWKSVAASEWSGRFPAIYAPSFIVDTLREIAGGTDRVVDITDIMTNPAHGHRAINSADQIAFFEWGTTRASSWVMTGIDAAAPGVRERELFEAMPWGGEPMPFHACVPSGDTVQWGLRSSSARRMELGDASVLCIGLWGANCARGGLLAASSDDLPSRSDGYIERLVAPYWLSMVAWYEQLAVGVPGGDVYAAVHSSLADAEFEPALNPGHLISYEEWMNSPIRDGSEDLIASGMVIQSDIIPTGIRPGWTTNCEDTVVIADANLRGELAERHPELWARVQGTRAYIATLGVELSEDVLPISTTALHLQPFWLSSNLAMAVR